MKKAFISRTDATQDTLLSVMKEDRQSQAKLHERAECRMTLTESTVEQFPHLNSGKNLENNILVPCDWTKFSPYCHPELADLCTAEQSESRIASRLSRLVQSSLGESLQAWSKSKTDSGSIQHGVLSVLLDSSRNKFGMTLKEMTLVCGFTMAEILLSLTIIGVVAAITLPSLTGNINERTWNTQRKALYARFSQAIALMPSLNGYGTLTEESSSGAGDAVDTAAETFITAGLSKVMKINNICDSEHIQDCGFAEQYTDMFGSKKDIPLDLLELNPNFQCSFTELTGASNSVYVINSKVAAFETANGESMLAYYNPTCLPELGRGGLEDFAQQKICANFVYDLNGNKGPNTMGKDMGVLSVFYPSDSIVVAPVVYNNMYSGVTQQQAGQNCRNLDNDARLPNLEEFMSISINYFLLGLNGHTSQVEFWTSKISAKDSSEGYVVHTTLGRVYSWIPRTNTRAGMCIHRYN